LTGLARYGSGRLTGKKYEYRDIEIQGVVEDIIRDPAEVKELLKNIQEITPEGNLESID